MGETAIEWTDRSVNPIRARLKGMTTTKGGYNSGVGHYCEKTSPGCKNCYASAMQPRFGLPQFQEQRNDATEPFFDVGPLLQVMKAKKGRRIFWCDMSDMFGRWVPFEWIAACFGVMAYTPQHTHQVLTKWPERALAFFSWLGGVRGPLGTLPADPLMGCLIQADRHRELMKPLLAAHQKFLPRWPLPNVHFGVSVENQDMTIRLATLEKIPAAVRWVSLEPLLSSVQLGRYLHGVLDWGVIGLESGPKARAGDVQWVRDLKVQFEGSEIPVFVKQLGAKPIGDAPMGILDTIARRADGRICWQLHLHDRKGGDPSEWPADLRVRMHAGDKWPA